MNFLISLIPANRPEIAILIGLLAIGIGILYIRHWISYILMLPIGILILFILGMFVVPLYPQGPNVEGFFRRQETLLIIVPDPASTAEITMKTDEGILQIISTQNAIQEAVKGFGNTQISFISQNTGEKAQCFIQIPNGIFIQLYPQSALLLSGKYPNLEIKALQGLVSYTSGEDISQSNIRLEGIQADHTPNVQRDELRSTFQQGKIAFLSKQIIEFSSNPTINEISKTYLQILSSLFPGIYTKDLSNYYQFQKYITPTPQIDQTVDPNISKDVINEANRGWHETKIYQWRKQLTQ